MLISMVNVTGKIPYSLYKCIGAALCGVLAVAWYLWICYIVTPYILDLEPYVTIVGVILIALAIPFSISIACGAMLASYKDWRASFYALQVTAIELRKRRAWKVTGRDVQLRTNVPKSQLSHVIIGSLLVAFVVFWDAYIKFKFFDLVELFIDESIPLELFASAAIPIIFGVLAGFCFASFRDYKGAFRQLAEDVAKVPGTELFREEERR